MTEIVVSGKALTSADFPKLPVGTRVYYFERECWRSGCDQRMTLWLVHGTELWSMNRLEAHPQVIELIARATRGDGIERAADAAPLAVLQEVVTKPAGLYLGFCCPDCGMVQGDFYMTKEFLSMLRHRDPAVKIALTV